MQHLLNQRPTLIPPPESDFLILALKKNKLLFKSVSSLAYLGNSSYDKGINHTTSLKQKKLSHLNALPCFTRGNDFAFTDTKTKGSLHWDVFLFIAKESVTKTRSI